MKFSVINEVTVKKCFISTFLFSLFLISLIIVQAVFQRYLRPEKDYVSFSLIYNNGKRSLDLVSDSLSDCIDNYTIIVVFDFFIFHYNNLCVVFQICKDKVEADVWISGLKKLISSGQGGRSKIDGWSDGGLNLDVNTHQLVFCYVFSTTSVSPKRDRPTLPSHLIPSLFLYFSPITLWASVFRLGS
jgi:hypothetical protein